MPIQSFTPTRRRFLKGSAYASALAIGGAAGLISPVIADTGSGSQYQPGDTEVIDLINHTASPVEFNGQSPESIAPGESKSFIVVAQGGGANSANNKNVFITDVLANDQLAVSSAHAEFNGIFPITELGAHAA